jgi:D-apiose dehydrogenase
MSGRLKVAVAGAGYFARFHHDGWARLPEAELVGIADLDLEKARAAAAAVPGARAFDSVERMLDETGAELLDIATPPQSHAALARIAAARRLPAICQKPLAPTYAEAVDLVEAAEAAGILLVAHENFRFQPWWREARRLLDDGRFGRLHGVAFRLRPGDGQGPSAYLDRQPYFQTMPRLLVHETAIHFIDVFRFLLGEVEAAFADLRRLNPAIAGEDAGMFILRHAGAARSLFDGNRLNEHVAENMRLTMGESWLEGEGGVLRLDGFGRRQRARPAGPRPRPSARRRAAGERGPRLVAQRGGGGGGLRLGEPRPLGGALILRR